MSFLVVIEGGLGNPCLEEKVTVATGGLRPWPAIEAFVLEATAVWVQGNSVVDAIDPGVLGAFVEFVAMVLETCFEVDGEVHCFADPPLSRLRRYYLRSRKLARAAERRAQLSRAFGRHRQELERVLGDLGVGPQKASAVVLHELFRVIWLAAVRPVPRLTAKCTPAN